MCYLCSNVTFPLRNKSLNPNHFFFFAELANSNPLSLFFFVSLVNIVLLIGGYSLSGHVMARENRHASLKRYIVFFVLVLSVYNHEKKNSSLIECYAYLLRAPLALYINLNSIFWLKASEFR